MISESHNSSQTPGLPQTLHEPGSRTVAQNRVNHLPPKSKNKLQLPPEKGNLFGRTTSTFLSRRNSLISRNLIRQIAVPAIVVVVLGLILAAGGVFSAPAEVAEPRPRPLDVNVATAQLESGYDVTRSYLGKIESARDSQISFELAGKITVIHVDEGQAVEKDSLLAELDTKILRSNLASLTAQINSAQAQLDELIAGPRKEDIAAARANVQRWHSQLKLARITKERMTRLRESRSVSVQEVDESIYNEQIVSAQLDLANSKLEELVNGTRREKIDAQKAAIAQLKAGRNTISIQIEKSRLLAPFSGLIATRRLDEGEVVRAGQPVLELLDDQRIEARIGLPVDSIEFVASNSLHELVYAGKKVSALLKSVRPRKSASTRTVDVVFALPALGNLPAIGDIVRLEIVETAEQHGFWVPSSALFETYRGLWGCFVAVQQEPNLGATSTELRELEILHQDGDRSFVRGALLSGDHVITSGVHRLVNNQVIQVISADSAPGN